MKQFSEAERVWLAAALDFEASLTLRKCKPNKTTKNGAWQLYFQLASIDYPLIERAREITGCGSIFQENRLKYGHNNHRCWHFNICSNGLRHILPQIKPYLIAKNEQVDIALKALEFLKERGRYRRWRPALYENELQQLSQQMMDANKGAIGK